MGAGGRLAKGLLAATCLAGAACRSEQADIRGLHGAIEPIAPDTALDAQRYIGLRVDQISTFRTEGVRYRRTVTRVSASTEGLSPSSSGLRQQRVESLPANGPPVLESEVTYDVEAPEGPSVVAFRNPSGRSPPEAASQRALVLPATLQQGVRWTAGDRDHEIIGHAAVHADIGEQRDCVVVESGPSFRLRSFYCEAVGLTLVLEERLGRWHLEQILEKQEMLDAGSSAPRSVD